MVGLGRKREKDVDVLGGRLHFSKLLALNRLARLAFGHVPFRVRFLLEFFAASGLRELLGVTLIVM